MRVSDDKIVREVLNKVKTTEEFEQFLSAWTNFNKILDRSFEEIGVAGFAESEKDVESLKTNIISQIILRGRDAGKSFEIPIVVSKAK